MSAASSSTADYTKEVRFAVVMYGGVSLAIYINGIAQELLRLVRSTPKNLAGAPPPTGTERIYRKLSFLLAGGSTELERSESALNDPQPVPPTRFVVDILSGTSAGGINGIFLAKALANGQDMEQLKDLWVQEGDIETLINDQRSIEKPLSLQDPPPSLLNSERMYYELLKAFDGMDASGGPRSESELSPYVDEVDLFVTSTDLQGVVLPIQLSDDLVYERRHKNVLHFVYSSPEASGADETRNDFHAESNPFLAYAARCTSSFPFAFEPMCLCDADTILNVHKRYHHDMDCRSGSARWQKFYRDYLNPDGVPSVPFPQRAFGDGGYLDNKPFAYAIETLMKRSAPVPVDRKLLYIEPSPEHPEDDVERKQKPDAMDNVVLALLTLPRYETIREDLQRVLERNRLIDRVQRIIAGVDRDFTTPGTHGEHEGEWCLPESEMAKMDLAEMAKRYGPSYAAYQRLRIASVTDDLAKLVTRVAGFDEDSGYYLVIRSLVQAWRDLTYVEHRREGPTKPTLNQFLFQFDLAHPARRLNYLRRRIDVLYSLDTKALGFIEACGGTAPQSDAEKLAFRRELLNEKQVVNDAFVMLRHAGRSLRARPKSKERDTETDDSNVATQVLGLANEIMTVVKRECEAKVSEGQTKKRTPESLLLDYFLARRVPLPSADGAAGNTKQDEAEIRQRGRAFLEQHEEVQNSSRKLLIQCK